ncbi:MAG: SixA phosphatase family protein [Caulobacteraceae bacterium]
MRRLILFRHAKAEARAPGGQDIDRALTARGSRDAAVIGEVLAKAGLSPDLALVSPARRARETWECARGGFPGAAMVLRHGLYDASPEEVAAELEAGTGDADPVMVVGHNPSLHELATQMLVEGRACAAEIERVAAKFSTATAAALTFPAAGRVALGGLFHAADHGGDGE